MSEKNRPRSACRQHIIYWNDTLGAYNCVFSCGKQRFPFLLAPVLDYIQGEPVCIRIPARHGAMIHALRISVGRLTRVSVTL